MSLPSIVQLEDGWSKIQNNGIAVLEKFLDGGFQGGTKAQPVKLFSKEDYANLYTTVYNMCTQRTPNNWSEQLYKRYGEALVNYINLQVLPALKDKRGNALLLELKARWTNHKLYVKWMEKFFMYLDRYFVKLQSVDPLNTKGIQVFRDFVFEAVKGEVRTALLSVINSQREGEQIDVDLVKSIIDMYIDLGIGKVNVYVTEFEEQFLNATVDYYLRQATSWLSEDSFPEFMRKAEDAVFSEDKRVDAYLHRSTQPKLKHVVIQTVLASPQSKLLEKSTGVVYLLENDKREDLARMHRMFNLVEGGTAPIAQSFRGFVTSKGMSVVDVQAERFKDMSKNEALSDTKFIQSLLDLHDQYKSIVTECFNHDSLFQKALKEAFEVFINREISPRYNFALLMSSFCDRILKKRKDTLTEDDVEKLLAKMVDLFSFLTDKDLFVEIYRNLLAKRLLYTSSSSEDAEKCMIAKLKLKCGAQFTSKLEGMITDLSIASETEKDFQTWLADREEKKDLGLDFHVTVLTTGFWPTYPIQDVRLPPSMTKSIDVFQTFYQGRTQHRRLQWVHMLGQAEVVFKPQAEKKYFLNCNTFQALILLLFANDTAVDMDFGRIKMALGFQDDAMIAKLLATLCINPKCRILNRTSDGEKAKTISSTDKFSANMTFSSPRRVLKIPGPTTEETHNKERIEEDRSIAVEAAIVRIMKARKTLSHQQLVSEVLKQLAFFQPNPKVIKSRIEHLIDREYLERDTNNASQYKYLA